MRLSLMVKAMYSVSSREAGTGAGWVQGATIGLSHVGQLHNCVNAAIRSEQPKSWHLSELKLGSQCKWERTCICRRDLCTFHPFNFIISSLLGQS